MLLPNLPIVLPDYARPELAYTEPVLLALAGTGSSLTYAAAGPLIDVPLAIAATVVTSGTAGNRVFNLKVFDEDSNLLAQVVSPNAQPASTEYDYAASIQFANVFSSGAGTQCLPWPPVALLERWQLIVAYGPQQNGDVFKRPPVLTLMRIPTGHVGPRRDEPERPVLLPTPLVA